MSGFAGEQNALGARLHALSAAVEAARGRIPDHALDRSTQLLDRASERLRLSGDHTIVALAGATGSGKSSLFNRLTDLELAGVGVRRPTTTWALACAWGPDGAHDLLEWMGIPARHQVSRRGMLETPADGTSLEGLILLDLPDHDSTEIEHRMEMDRLIPYSDVVVWVLDPQKYADAAIHERYIRPMSGYADATVVVLNQIDRIEPAERNGALADVRRLLADAGLSGVPVIAASAATGEGIEQLRREIAARIRDKKAARERLAADVGVAAAEIAAVGGMNTVPGVTDTDCEALLSAIVDSVGVQQLSAIVAADVRRRATGSVAWPPLRIVGRRRRAVMAQALAGPAPGSSASMQAPQAQAAVRAFCERASVGLEGPWPGAVWACVGQDFAARLDDAVRSTRLRSNRPAAWWRVVNLLQWLAFVTFLAGAGWLIVIGLGAVVPFTVAAAPRARGFSLPLLLAGTGFAVSMLLWIVGALAARRQARRRARKARTRLRRAIDKVTVEAIINPVREELGLYERYRSSLSSALSRRSA